MIAVVAGMIGTYPMGGMAFHYGQYLLGLRALGWDVVYLEDTGRWVYDPVPGTFTHQVEANVMYLQRVMGEFGFADSWCLRDPEGRHFGPAAESLARIVRDADLFLNVSGACWLRPQYRSARHLVYIDTDPGYTQFKIAAVAAGTADAKLRGEVDLISLHDVHATFAENIEGEGCALPTQPFRWVRTRQPIHLALWSNQPIRHDMAFTTVLSWAPYESPFPHGDRAYYGKGPELERVLGVPARTPARFELAIAGRAPEAELRRRGWGVVPATTVTASPRAYRDYIASSVGEFSVAKDIYAATWSGWFSERSACYLSSGRPVVVQDTGFGHRIPTGEGVHAFTTEDEAVSAVCRVMGDYDHERRAARRIAEAFFDADIVLSHLLKEAGL